VTRLTRWAHFIGSRSGQGFILFVCLSQLIAAGVGYGFYTQNLGWFKEHKSGEEITALRLVDAFVNNYAILRGQFGSDAPVPATFRADSITAFNKAQGAESELQLQWVGVPNREIKTAPSDPAMAATISTLAAASAPAPVTRTLVLGDQEVLRTIYPSVAREQACVDCHNKIQTGKAPWHLNDVMGAFVIDVPMASFTSSNLREAFALALAVFAALAAVGLFFARSQYKNSLARDAAEADLADSEMRFRDFAEAASDWFWEQDENLRFIRFSGSGRSTGITSTSDVGKTRHETVKLGVSPEQWAAHDADLAARRPFHNFRFQRALPNDESRILHVSVSGKPVFDANGRFRGYRGAGRDITAEVAVETELQRRVEERTAALKAAQGELLRKERLSALGQLTATMAHELRNPLSAIRNTLFSVKETAAASGVDLARPLGRVERSVERCDRIIKDLLDYTRIKDLHRNALAPDPWVGEVLDEQKLPEGVALIRQLDAKCLVAIDTERMRRVIINLLDNAAQAMADRDGPHRITVSTAVAGQSFELKIEDNGAGIPADVLPKVFEPLYSTKSFGTGLGLPMVKQIVEQHGGTIAITSEHGKGTRVIVRLQTAAQNEEIAA